MYITIMIKNKFLTFILFFVITYTASLIGGLATINFKEPWYSLIIRPSFSPPDWVFAPVWTTLYFMMTLAVWLFWHGTNRDIKTVCIYFIHIIVNTTWSITFFVFHQIAISILVLIILITLIIILIRNFKRVNLMSSYLMIPYLLWCCFALVLNVSIFILN